MGMPTGSNPTIQKIIDNISEGDYRIPRFQRDFVWEIKKSAALLDSIFKGYPIGSIILWKTKQELTEVRNIGGIEIPHRDNGKYTSYIIDGQQRLTSLYFSLKGLKNDVSDFSEMCISLVAKDGDQLVFETIPNGASKDDYVLLKDLYSAKALLGSHNEKRVEFYKTLLQYTISVIEIDDENLGLDEVVEIFERLNLGGKSLTLFSIISARSYKMARKDEEGNDVPGFDLSKEYEELIEKLKDNNYGEISDSTFLQAIAACTIGKVNRGEILKNLDYDSISPYCSYIKSALFDAIEHLKRSNYGVLVSNLLPYEHILVAFTYFHYKMRNKQITSNQESYLIDFFWRCVVGTRYTKSTDTNLNADIIKIQKIVDGEKPSQEPIVLSPKFIFDNGRFKVGSAFIKGMLCLLALNSPQSFAEGRNINITKDAVSTKAERQNHHFFPQKCKAIQSNNDYKTNVDNIVNIVLMDGLTNNQIKDRNPSDYTAEFNRNNKNFETVLSSHYISLAEFGIEDNNYHAFINARSKALYKKLNDLIITNTTDTITDTSAI